MNKLRDIFYDKNDILIAVVILCLAALIIFFRVDAIMEYPKTLVGDLPVVTKPDVTTPDPSATDGAVVVEPEVEMLAVYINPGDSINTIAQNFVAAGIFESTEQFTQLVSDMGVATKVKTGNFIMPSDITTTAAIEMILKPGL